MCILGFLTLINLGLKVGEEEEAMREREGRQQSFFEKVPMF